MLRQAHELSYHCTASYQVVKPTFQLKPIRTNTDGALLLAATSQTFPLCSCSNWTLQNGDYWSFCRSTSSCITALPPWNLGHLSPTILLFLKDYSYTKVSQDVKNISSEKWGYLNSRVNSLELFHSSYASSSSWLRFVPLCLVLLLQLNLRFKKSQDARKQ